MIQLSQLHLQAAHSFTIPLAVQVTDMSTGKRNKARAVECQGLKLNVKCNVIGTNRTKKHPDTDRAVESHDLSGGSFKFGNFVSNTFAMPSSESNWNVFSPGSLTLQLASCQFHNHASCMLAMP